MWSLKSILTVGAAVVGGLWLLGRLSEDEEETWSPPRGRPRLEPSSRGGSRAPGEPGYREVLVDDEGEEVGFVKLNDEGTYDVYVFGPGDRTYYMDAATRRDIAPTVDSLIASAVLEHQVQGWARDVKE